METSVEPTRAKGGSLQSLGCLAGIVETVGRKAATAPRKSKSGGESGTGSGPRGRLEGVGKLRCGVSFKFHHLSNSIHQEFLAAHHVLSFSIQ